MFKWLRRVDVPRFFVRKVTSAHEAGLQAVASASRQRAPRRTGEYAGSITYSASGLRGQVGSRLPQAGAVERGANVGARVGPHMRGQPTIRPAAQTEYRRGFQSKSKSGGIG